MQRGTKEQLPELGPGKGAQTSRGVRRRGIVLQVAAALFAERGFDSVSINDIGVAAGITGPAIYRYFPSKEALVVSIYTHLYQRYDTETTAILTESLGPWQSLERLIDLQVRLATEEPEKIRIIDSEERHLPLREAEEFRAENRRRLRVWVDLLARARPDLSREECEVTVHALLAMVNSISHKRSGVPQPSPILDHVRRMAWMMISTGAPARSDVPLPPPLPPADAVPRAPRLRAAATPPGSRPPEVPRGSDRH